MPLCLPKFEPVVFGGLTYHDTSHLDRDRMIASSRLLGAYLKSFPGHICSSDDKTMEGDRRIADLTLEECNGDFFPRNFAAFTRDGECIDVFNIHAMTLVRRKNDRLYLQCRAAITLDHLEDDREYARGQIRFYKWLVETKFEFANGDRRVEFVSAFCALNESATRLPPRLRMVTDLIRSDFGNTGDKRHKEESYQHGPSWRLFRMYSKSREDDSRPGQP